MLDSRTEDGTTTGQVTIPLLGPDYEGQEGIAEQRFVLEGTEARKLAETHESLEAAKKKGRKKNTKRACPSSSCPPPPPG